MTLKLIYCYIQSGKSNGSNSLSPLFDTLTRDNKAYTLPTGAKLRLS